MTIKLKLQDLAFALPALLIIVFQLMGEQFSYQLAFVGQDIQQGQWWRFYSGHFVHFTLYHSCINLAGLAIISLFLFRDKSVWHWLLSMWAICTVISCLMLSDYQLMEYRGFSACFYGMLVYGCIINLTKRSYTLMLIVFGVVAKILMEQMPDYDIYYLQEQINVAVAIDAHLYGVCAGLVFAGCFRIFSLFKKQSVRLDEKAP